MKDKHASSETEAQEKLKLTANFKECIDVIARHSTKDMKAAANAFFKKEKSFKAAPSVIKGANKSQLIALIQQHYDGLNHVNAEIQAIADMQETQKREQRERNSKELADLVGTIKTEKSVLAENERLKTQLVKEQTEKESLKAKLAQERSEKEAISVEKEALKV